MRWEKFSLEVKTTVTQGAAQQCKDLELKWVQIGGTFPVTGSVAVQATINGVNWYDKAVITNPTAAPPPVEVEEPAEKVRIDTRVAITVGAVNATLAGRNERTE